MLALAALVAAGLLLDALGLIDRRAALDWARGHHAGWLTAAVIVGVLDSEDVADLLDAATLGPLLAIALLLLVGRAVQRRRRDSRD